MSTYAMIIYRALLAILVGSSHAMATEEAPFTVVDRQGPFELRQYQPYVVGEPVFARYNPPFMPWFLRRNEILVPVR
jgi:hypothetical protein